MVNGFGAFLAREIREMPEGQGVRMRTLGIPDEFIAHGGRAALLREIDLDAQGIEEWVREMVATPEALEIGSVVSPAGRLPDGPERAPADFRRIGLVGKNRPARPSARSGSPVGRVSGSRRGGGLPGYAPTG